MNYGKHEADFNISTEIRLNELAISSKERKDQIYYEPQNLDTDDDVSTKNHTLNSL